MEIKKRAKVTCEFCNGTGGSSGNDDPADNWICAACNGTGSYDDGYDPDPEPATTKDWVDFERFTSWVDCT